MTENEMAGWHYQLNGHEFELVMDREAQRACSSWDNKELDTTE